MGAVHALKVLLQETTAGDERFYGLVVSGALLWRGSLLPLVVGAAEGCDLLILIFRFKWQWKDRSLVALGSSYGLGSVLLFQIAAEELLEPFALGIAQHVFRRAFFFH